MPDAIAVMSAKAVSSRLPGKNKRLLHGAPLFSYGLISALRSSIFKRVLLSTDDDDIIRTAASMEGVEVDIRPAAMRDNSLTADQVTAELLLRLGGSSSYPVVCLLNPCCPLVQPHHLSEALDLFFASQANMVASVTPIRFDPTYTYQQDGVFIKRRWSGTKVRTDKSNNLYYANGALNIIWSELLIRNQTIFVDPTAGYIMDECFAYDIDTLEEFESAERQMNLLASCGAIHLDPYLSGEGKDG